MVQPTPGVAPGKLLQSRGEVSLWHDGALPWSRGEHTPVRTWEIGSCNFQLIIGGFYSQLIFVGFSMLEIPDPGGWAFRGACSLP